MKESATHSLPWWYIKTSPNVGFAALYSDSGNPEICAYGIWNPGLWNTELSSRNLESKSHLAPKIHNQRRRIENPKLSWISFYEAIIEWIPKTWNNSGTILFNVLAAFQGLTHTEKVEFTKQRLFSSTKKAHRAFLHSHNLR